mmetsp:Transcript_20586/g.28890  ORF Transcript_20586/g.28890 Transcript_20586/m.28890 type:complete len:780 (-) Transcript_20586:41-2380(-)
MERLVFLIAFNNVDEREDFNSLIKSPSFTTQDEFGHTMLSIYNDDFLLPRNANIHGILKVETFTEKRQCMNALVQILSQTTIHTLDISNAFWLVSEKEHASSLHDALQLRSVPITLAIRKRTYADWEKCIQFAIQNTRVTGLVAVDLQDLKTLPELLFEVTHLELLNVSCNNLTQIPPTIQKLTNLSTLDISHNNLKTLPFREMRSLKLTKLKLEPNPFEVSPNSIPDMFQELNQKNANGIVVSSHIRVYVFGDEDQQFRRLLDQTNDEFTIELGVVTHSIQAQKISTCKQLHFWSFNQNNEHLAHIFLAPSALCILVVNDMTLAKVHSWTQLIAFRCQMQSKISNLVLVVQNELKNDSIVTSLSERAETIILVDQSTTRKLIESKLLQVLFNNPIFNQHIQHTWNSVLHAFIKKATMGNHSEIILSKVQAIDFTTAFVTKKSEAMKVLEWLHVNGFIWYCESADLVCIKVSYLMNLLEGVMNLAKAQKLSTAQVTQYLEMETCLDLLRHCGLMLEDAVDDSSLVVPSLKPNSESFQVLKFLEYWFELGFMIPEGIATQILVKVIASLRLQKTLFKYSISKNVCHFSFLDENLQQTLRVEDKRITIRVQELKDNSRKDLIARNVSTLCSSIRKTLADFDMQTPNVSCQCFGGFCSNTVILSEAAITYDMLCCYFCIGIRNLSHRFSQYTEPWTNMQKLAVCLSKDWMRLGMEAQFPSDRLKRMEITHNVDPSFDPVTTILTEWMHGKDATVGKLISMCEEIGNDSAVRELRSWLDSKPK